MSSTNVNFITRRSVLQILSVLPFAGLIPALSAPKEPTPDLYQACIDTGVEAIEMAHRAMKLRDGNGTAEQARAQLAKLKAAVEAIVI